MNNVTFPIHHTFGPLATDPQCVLSKHLLHRPWQWKHGKAVEELRMELSIRFGRSAALFDTGRNALLATLRALELRQGEEVIIPGLTCVVVPNAIHVLGGVPKYCDIEEETLGMHLDKLQGLITHRTRAVICQHTFGIPENTERLRAICSKRNLILIEDCAHVIPEDPARERQQPRPVGMLGDVLIFSFGRDKAISGVSGGAALTQHPDLAMKIASQERTARSCSFWHIHNLLAYPIRYRRAKKYWMNGIGKIYLRALRLCRCLPLILTADEKRGNANGTLRRIPNACAALALQQLASVASFNEHRRNLTKLYLRIAQERGWVYPALISETMPLQKFPMYLEEPHVVRSALKLQQIYLDDGWSGAVVNPKTVDPAAAGYARGMCPVADRIASHLLTLPTHPTMSEEQMKALIDLL